MLAVGPEASGAAAAIEAAALQPMTPATERWLVADLTAQGELEERQVELVRSLTDRFGATLAQRMGEGETLLLALSPQGDVVMPASISHRDRAISIFDPPLLICPARLELGVATESKASMKVVDEANEASVRQTGRARRSIVATGWREVTTPMGRFTAARIEIEFQASLQLASAQERSVQYVAPGLGLVAEERHEEIRAFGVLTRRRDQTAVRLAP